MAHSSRPGSFSRSKPAKKTKRSSASEKFKQNAGLESPERAGRNALKSQISTTPTGARPGPSGFRSANGASQPVGASRTTPSQSPRAPKASTSITRSYTQPSRSGDMTRSFTAKPVITPGITPNSSNPFRHEERAERGANAPLHRPVAHGIVAALGVIMIEGRYADKVIERAFKADKNMGGRDRKAFAEMVYEIVRWWRRYGAAIGWDTENETRKLEIADIWKWLAVYLVEKSVKLGHPPTLPSWDEFKTVDPKDVANRLSDLDPVRDRATIESIPDWVDALGEKELGSRWPAILHALNSPAPVVLRANTLKCTRDELIARLKDENGISSQAAYRTDCGIVLSERKNVFTTDAFKDGWFEVQDGASQQAAMILDPKPGERVIDACAGAGGKTLAIGAMMKNKGRLTSLDIEERKLQELRRRVARAGVDTNEAKVIDSAKVIKRLEKSADKVLLDVPCTGLGVVRRNPDKKWKLKIGDLERLMQIQAEILDEYTLMAKVGGTVVYATCSCLPSENRGQIDAFLARNKAKVAADAAFAKFELVNDRVFWPGDDNYDGFYTAVLKRIT